MAIRALDAIYNSIWCIQPETIELMAEIAERPMHDEEALKAVAAQIGRPLDNTRCVTVRDGGVAVIPVTGPMFRHADLFTRISGAVSTETIASDLKTALARDDVRAIVFDVDSPGGEASGIDDLASVIYEARGDKPIWAYVSGVGASGAYWLSAACDRVFLSPASQVGSIGVVLGFRDYSVAEEKRGVKTLQWVSSQSPNKRPDHNTEAGRAEIQRRVDEVAQVFINEVGKFRGVSPEHVVDKFGAGGMLVGANAVAVGAADAVGNFDALTAALGEELGAKAERASRLGESPVSDEQKNDTPQPAPPWWTQLYNALTPSARADAAARAAMGGDGQSAFIVGQLRQPGAQGQEPTPGVNDEVANLRRQMDAMLEQQARTTAVHLMEEAVRAGRAMPAEDVEAFVADYVQAVKDDAASPVKFTLGEGDKARVFNSRAEIRVRQLQSRVPHRLFSEVLDPQQRYQVLSGAQVPGPSTSQDQALDDADASARAYAQRANGRETKR